MWKELIKLQKEKEKPKEKYSLEAIYPFRFDKDIYMSHFLVKVEIIKYEKYHGESDLQDYIRELYTLNMEFMNGKTYLKRLFPTSLSGQAMESFTKLSLPI